MSKHRPSFEQLEDRLLLASYYWDPLPYIHGDLYWHHAAHWDVIGGPEGTYPSFEDDVYIPWGHDESRYPVIQGSDYYPDGLMWVRSINSDGLEIGPSPKIRFVGGGSLWIEGGTSNWKGDFLREPPTLPQIYQPSSIHILGGTFNWYGGYAEDIDTFFASNATINWYDGTLIRTKDVIYQNSIISWSGGGYTDVDNLYLLNWATLIAFGDARELRVTNTHVSYEQTGGRIDFANPGIGDLNGNILINGDISIGNNGEVNFYQQSNAGDAGGLYRYQGANPLRILVHFGGRLLRSGSGTVYTPLLAEAVGPVIIEDGAGIVFVDDYAQEQSGVPSLTMVGGGELRMGQNSNLEVRSVAYTGLNITEGSSLITTGTFATIRGAVAISYGTLTIGTDPSTMSMLSIIGDVVFDGGTLNITIDPNASSVCDYLAVSFGSVTGNGNLAIESDGVPVPGNRYVPIAAFNIWPDMFTIISEYLFEDDYFGIQMQLTVL